MANKISKAIQNYPIRAFFILLFVTLLYWLLLILPFLEISRKLFAIPSWAIFLLASTPIAGRLAYRFHQSEFTQLLARIAMTWIGVFFLYGSVRLLVAILALLFFSDPGSSTALIIALTLGAGLCIYAIYNALQLKLKTISLQSSKISRIYNIVQISDVHLGSRSAHFLPKIVHKVAQVDPELLLITGDFIDMDGITRADLSPLQTLTCPIYFIIGNHERYIELDEVLRTLSAVGVKILRNTSEQWHELELIGIDDSESKNKVNRELPTISRDQNLFQLLMYHRPDSFKFAADSGVDLMICGHTHNGQIIPFNFLVKRVFKRIHGLYTEDKANLYVSPGTGTWGPVMRLGSGNEITRILLNP